MRASMVVAMAALAACGAAPAPEPKDAAEGPFTIQVVAQYAEPWAMAFLPDGRFLVTEKQGTLRVGTGAGQKSAPIAGVPAVAYGGQGGLGDVALHPDFASNRIVYLSYAEAGEGDTRGAPVAMAKLAVGPGTAGGKLEDVKVIWRQEPKVTGRGHYGHRLIFSPDGQSLFVTSGDRQKFTPAQDMNQNLGKIVRLTPTGGIPSDNPFYDQGRVKAQIWASGIRNPLGIAFDGAGRLWEVEHGPAGGDELNLVRKGANYGWPVVSDGDHYDGRPIPDNRTRAEFEKPKTGWSPVIAPGEMIIYSGDQFPAWKGDALITGLATQALVRVDLDGETAREAERYTFENRLRGLKQGPDGALWVLEDGKDGAGGRLLKLSARGRGAQAAGQ